MAATIPRIGVVPWWFRDSQVMTQQTVAADMGWAGMWNRLRDAVLWAQALDRYGRQDFRAAITKLNAIQGRRRQASECLALLGSAHVALGKPEARNLLLKAMADSEPTRPEYRGYVRAYCEYYLAALDGNDGVKIRSLETALRMGAPSIICRWLPLS